MADDGLRSASRDVVQIAGDPTQLRADTEIMGGGALLRVGSLSE
jgi:hypothetical protein